VTPPPVTVTKTSVLEVEESWREFIAGGNGPLVSRITDGQPQFGTPAFKHLCGKIRLVSNYRLYIKEVLNCM
jgi:hypothetical protein